ncbi:MAG: hypothetical protein RLZZ200_1652 [Pseudomonadota bacterium]
MSARHIAAGWSQYAEHVLPKEAGAVQKTETRRAFYAGAVAVLARVMAQVSDEDEVTDQDMQVMDDIMAELEEFKAELEAGRR